MSEHSVHLTNDTDRNQYIWLEPWAEEFSLPKGGSAKLVVQSDSDQPRAPEIEQGDNGPVVYASGGTRVRVIINGEEQFSASATLTCPHMGSISTKSFVDAAFFSRPAPRSGRGKKSHKLNWLRRFLARRV